MHNDDIEVSVVMPCLNEEETVGICVKKALETLTRLSIKGEVIVVDNGSKDNSVKIAQACGAKVVFEPEKGYGSAYLRGFSEAKGRYIIMGDSDDTYDFSGIDQFLQPLKNGYDFVIGSRFKGTIHSGAMPWPHRYIGNPILTSFLKFLFKTDITDAHCGMRAFTKNAFEKMHLRTTGMELASEMIVSALAHKLRVAEVAVDYHPRKGQSKLIPLKDAWRHIRFMLLFSPTYLFLIPGYFLFICGSILLVILARGPLFIFGRAYDYHSMFIASLMAILGFQIMTLGFYARTYSLMQGFVSEDKTLVAFYKYFNLEKGLILGALIFLIGVGLNFYILYKWVSVGLGAINEVRRALLALTFMIIGIQTIFSSCFLSILGIKKHGS